MSAQSMQWLDWTILFLVGSSILFGVIRGFIRGALSLATWVLAVFLSMNLADSVSGHFVQTIPNKSLQHAVAFGVIFLGTLFVGMIFARVISKLSHSVGLSGTDRFLGLIFGFVRGALIVGVLLLLGSLTSFSNRDVWKESVLRPYWDPLVVWMKNWVQAQDVDVEKVKAEVKKVSIKKEKVGK